MYKLTLELNEGCNQVLYLDTKVISNEFSLSKLCNDIRNDLKAIGYKLEKLEKI